VNAVVRSEEEESSREERALRSEEEEKRMKNVLKCGFRNGRKVSFAERRIELYLLQSQSLL
jgi:hypothetical protein